MAMRDGRGRGIDPRDLPAFGIREAARYLDLPPETVRRWINDSRDAAGFLYPPMVTASRDEAPQLSFWNVGELYMLRALTRHERVNVKNVRLALESARRLWPDLAHPLLSLDLETNGVEVFTRDLAGIINLSRGGHLALERIVAGSLRRIERDDEHLVTRLPLFRQSHEEPKEVMIDLRFAFGRRAVYGTGIPTEALAERYRGGETVADLVDDYDLPLELVIAALTWEKCNVEQAA